MSELYERDSLSDNSKNENPNWQFVGKLKDISIFKENEKNYSLIKTNTTFFVIEGIIKEAVHVGQTVKLSKRDNAAKIGSILVYRPQEEKLIEPIENRLEQQ